MTVKERRLRRFVFYHMVRKYRFESASSSPARDTEDYLNAYYRYGKY